MDNLTNSIEQVVEENSLPYEWSKEVLAELKHLEVKNNKRDDLVLFYFRNGAEYASVYTKSNVISENIKWNKSIKSRKVKALLVNARNANCLTGMKGFNSLKEIAE